MARTTYLLGEKMNRFVRRIALIFIALLLSACAHQNVPAAQGRAPLPGDAQFYSYGISQSKENFANVARAQSHYALYSTERHWVDIQPFKAPAMINVLQAYYPLHVRWELKDGRQFILEDIDVTAIMREYFKTHRLKLQHQEESRARDAVGDYGPSFVHEIRSDSVILKWLLTTNHTPVNERLKTNGAANRWTLTEREFLVIELKGHSTEGLDFEKKWEFNRTQKAKE
ncbi:MAG: hypothetical protein EOP84_30850 [Verrucomicrobiaceae bacterium]|nr:MAG: hypothetical protein EOP84_30850 [Verrucomicrobiaceae bacterium]